MLINEQVIIDHSQEMAAILLDVAKQYPQNKNDDPKENHELVKSYLNGYSFEIVDKEDKYLASLWKETITLRSVTNGWAYGVQFSLPRGHVYHILNGHDPVGLTFEVE